MYKYNMFDQPTPLQIRHNELYTSSKAYALPKLGKVLCCNYLLSILEHNEQNSYIEFDP